MRHCSCLLLSLFMIEPAAAIDVFVPFDCVELAAREGYPTDYMTEAQAKKANIRLTWLMIQHPKDPIVQKCVLAIKLVEESMRAVQRHVND